MDAVKPCVCQKVSPARHIRLPGTKAWFSKLDENLDEPFMPEGLQQPAMPEARKIFDE